MNIFHTETLKKWGGQQNRVLLEALGLQDRGHKVIIACHRESVLSQKAKHSGIKVYEMNMVKQAYPAIIIKLIKIIREENIDIVSTHSSVDSWAGGIAARLAGRKLVRFRHNLYPPGRGLLVKFIYTIPDKIIAISNTVKDVLINSGVNKDKLTIIPSAVDTQRFQYEVQDFRDELKISPETLIIGNTSTFTEVKGQIYLLQAFNSISKKIPCVLMFAGRLNEPSLSRYLSYVNKEFRDKVVFLGHRDDIPKVLKTIDIFVYPSYMEGLGTALLEAMTMKRPVAVSDIPTFHEFIEDGMNGLYFKPKDPDDLAKKVVVLLQNRELREKLGSNAGATAIKRFTVSRMIELTETCYKEVVHAI